MRRVLPILLTLPGLACALGPARGTPSSRPNIVVVLADDLGCGDLSHAGGLAPTPFIDRLAVEGQRFSDAHTSAAVCTPTRYSILTGRYNWRSTLERGVLWGPSRPLIEVERPTIASFLSAQGYRTGVVGKWHLGLGWSELEVPREATSGRTEGPGWNLDYTRRVTGGPLELGFESSFLFPASLDMPPYVYLRDGVPVGVPTVTKSFAPPVRPGPATEDFEAVKCLRELAGEARAFVSESARDERPFFLYLPLTSPHTPIEPAPAFLGKSGLGIYGDFLMETDWVVGEVLAELEQQGALENTLFVFTSDNGASPAARLDELEALGHVSSGIWRGHKADIYEGGHRVPLIVRWPGHTAAGTCSRRLVSSVDLFATFAEILGAPLPAAGAEDSFSFAGAIGDTRSHTRPRTSLVHHSINGSFAIRRGRWKLALCPGSGGWSEPRPPASLRSEDLPPCQLFDLEADPGETTNLFEERPDIAAELVAELVLEIERGFTRPGATGTSEGWPSTMPDRVTARFPELAR